MYGEYRFFDASFVTANDIPTLLAECDGIDTTNAEQTLADYDAAIETSVAFDPTTKDGKSTKGLALSKSNWAQKLDPPPFYAYPVTGGVTFTYGGLKIAEADAVIDTDGTAIPNLFACG